MSRIAIIYYSSTGATYTIAQAYVEGATEAGAEVRLRRAAELAPQSVIDSNEAWAAHQDETKHIEIATPADLAWLDGYILGAPTRFGQPASQLKQFIDTTSGPWVEGQLAVNLPQYLLLLQSAMVARKQRCCRCTIRYSTGVQPSYLLAMWIMRCRMLLEETPTV